jgi:sugar lactone lactonase YvrE
MPLLRTCFVLLPALFALLGPVVEAEGKLGFGRRSSTGALRCRRVLARRRPVVLPRGAAGRPSDEPTAASATVSPPPQASSPPPSRSLELPYGGELQFGVNAIARLPDGETAFGTERGLVLWDGKSFRAFTGPYFDPLLYRSGNARGNVPGNSGLPSNRVQDLLVAGDGRLWIATMGGLAWFKDGKIENITARLPSTGDESEQVWERTGNQGRMTRGPHLGHDVMRLFQRSNGQIVVGTRNAGVFLYDPPIDQFQLVHRAPEGNQWVTAFAEERDGSLWIAVRGLGLLRYVDGKIHPLPLPPAAGKPEDVWTLALGTDGTLWIGTTHGLVARQPDGRSQVFTAADGLTDDFVGKLWVDRDGNLWVVGSEGVAVRRQGKWFYPEFAGGEPHFTQCFTKLPDGDLWIAATTGLLREPPITWHSTSGPQRELAKYKAAVEANHPSLAGHPLVAKDDQGCVWIGLRKTLVRYDGQKWTDLTSILGEKREISFVRADSLGRVWVGTSGNGLFRITGEQTENFFNLEGRATSVIYSMAEAKDGTVYIGAQFGFYAFRGAADPETISTRYQVHPLVVDGRGRAWGADVNTGLLLYDGEDVRELSKDPELQGWHVYDLQPFGADAVRAAAYSQSTTGPRYAVFQCDGKTVTREASGGPAEIKPAGGP